MTSPARRVVIRLLLAGIAAVALAAFPGTPGAPASEGDELVSLARREKRVLIADFGLGLCRQCKAQSEILDKVRAVYKDKVIVRMVHVNKEHELTARYRVETIPHLVFLDASGEPAFRKTGVMKYEDIVAQLSRMGVRP